MSRGTDRLRGQRGTSLVELMTVIGITGMLTVAVVKAVGSMRASMARHENSSEIMLRHQRMSANLRASLSSASLLLADYSQVSGPDYNGLRALVRSSVTASGSPPPAAFSKAPSVLTLAKAPVSGTALTDNAPFWGNELMYVVNVKPVTFTVQYAPALATYVADTLSIDRIQFVYLYLAHDPSIQVPGSPNGALRLIEWRSQPYVLRNALVELTDVTGGLYHYRKRHTMACATLANMGYVSAFDMDAAHDVNASFYKVTGTAPTLELEPPPVQIPRSTWAYLEDFDYQASFLARAGLDQGRASQASGNSQSGGPSRLAIAFNTLNPSVNPEVKVNRLEGPGRSYLVPAFAQMDTGGLIGFPGGFELIVIGKPKAREVYLRKVLMSVHWGGYQSKPETYLAHEFIDIIAVRNDR